jgi:hypothetical protein
MKAVTLLKVLAVSAISSLSLAGSAAQAGDSCVLSSLSRPAASVEGGNASEGCGNTNHRSSSSAQDQGMMASIAPLAGSMAKNGIQTASSLMRALTHEASQLLQE